MFAALGIVARVPAHPLAGPLDAEGGGGPARPRHRLVGGGTDRGARVRPLLDHRPALLLFVAIGLVAVLFDATSPGLTGMRLSGFLVMFGLALLVAWSGGVAVIAMSAGRWRRDAALLRAARPGKGAYSPRSSRGDLRAHRGPDPDHHAPRRHRRLPLLTRIRSRACRRGVTMSLGRGSAASAARRRSARWRALGCGRDERRASVSAVRS